MGGLLGHRKRFKLESEPNLDSARSRVAVAAGAQLRFSAIKRAVAPGRGWPCTVGDPGSRVTDSDPPYPGGTTSIRPVATTSWIQGIACHQNCIGRWRIVQGALYWESGDDLFGPSAGETHLTPGSGRQARSVQIAPFTEANKSWS